MDASTSVLDSIAARDAARRDKLAEAAADRSEGADSQANSVIEQLQSRKVALEAQLRSTVPPAADKTKNSASDAAAAAAAPDMAAVVAELNSLQQYLAVNAYLLPSYTLRTWEAAVEALRQSAAAAKAAREPRKKFSFSSKARTKPPPLPETAAAADAQPAATDTVNGSTADAAAAGPRQPQAATPSDREGPEPSARVLRGTRGSKVVKMAEELAGGDFDVTDAEDCTILLLGPLAALRLNNVRRCCIVAGPVDGAAFLDDVHDSTVALAAHQVRVHTSAGSKLFLEVGSNPIIEHCHDMAFGPLTPQQRALLDLHPASATNSRWGQVQDFNWLRATQSPNWRQTTAQENAAANCPSRGEL